MNIDIQRRFRRASADAKLHISQGHWSGRSLSTSTRRSTCRTYGISDDGRYFGPAIASRRTAGRGHDRSRDLEDLWHVSTPYLTRRARPSFSLRRRARAARPPRAATFAPRKSCRLMDRFYASYLTVYVCLSSCRPRGCIAFWGGSEIVAPDGTVVARAAEFDEELLIGEIDPELVARERARNPLLRDEREDIVLRNIAGRLGLPFDRRD